MSQVPGYYPVMNRHGKPQKVDLATARAAVCRHLIEQIERIPLEAGDPPTDALYGIPDPEESGGLPSTIILKASSPAVICDFSKPFPSLRG